MSEPLHSGAHPDADSLSAFLEGALPEHERLECLAHFAHCPSCREIVFLAQEPPPAPAAPQPTPAWRRWWIPVAVLSGAAACALVVAVSLTPRYTAVAPAQAVAESVPPPTAAAPPPVAQPRAVLEHAEAKIKPARRDSPTVASASPASAPVTAPQPAMARSVAAPVPPESLSVAGSNSSSLPGAGPLRLAVQHDAKSIDGLPEIDGSVTDPAGAGVSGATVTLAQASGAPAETARTDASGKFAIPEIPAGKYELRIVAPGFQTVAGQVELQAKDLATVAPVLSVGSLTETVQVTASASAVLQTAPPPKKASDLSEQMTIAPRMSIAQPLVTTLDMPPGAHPLPSKLPAVTTAASGKLLLAADSAGALFYSGNTGKSWKAVKSVWPGKAVALVKARDGFQLTAESGSVWVSQDGLHWRESTPQR